ncbi:MAG: carbonic anhydrase, partial [Thermomicrobia bacterium]|nr:carbonic anhydrase [Thermomicrobia bacterium]
MTVVDTLIARNRDFAARQFTANRPLFPTLETLVLGCVDPRVDPAHLLGLRLGEAAVIRNIGGRVTPATLRELAMLAMLPQLNGARPPPASGPAAGRGLNIVVLHHTDCGITRLAKVPDRLADYFGVTPDELESRAVLDPYAA